MSVTYFTVSFKLYESVLCNHTVLQAGYNKHRDFIYMSI